MNLADGVHTLSTQIDDLAGNQAQASVTFSVVTDPNDIDQDGDGFSPNAGDCDDQDLDVYPGADEVCNGIDDNCDMAVDEGFNTGTSCSDGVGACAASGVIVCLSDTTATCNAVAGAPQAEICDDLDNDCDGTIDNGFDVGLGCSAGVGACESAGYLVCSVDGTATVCDAVPGSPEAEICGNGIDEDCDGEDLACSGGGLPPDPEDVAPALDMTVATTVIAANRFLFTGSDPIQTGVADGTIAPERVAVLRGKVSERSDAPLSGVTITILNHPEFGQTLSRLDGMFDLAVNGGGVLTVYYQKEGYLSAQRTVNVPWQDYVELPDVVLIPVDQEVTTVDLTAGIMQVAQGSVETDTDGTRQATILFPSGVSAQMVMPDGSLQPLDNIDVRATEYTVGDNGLEAMPGELPPTTGYTYAVELSADEAIAAGAKRVT
ncbi:MAG: putative metal-binding motif-containing protein, partial [Hyphomicrobiaceae bacterium]|nr:putative metal-binding motif-containing protein [Hyphomicrobiaceae bacterium]